MVEDDDASVLLRQGAECLDEGDALGGRALCVALFVMTLHELRTAPQPPRKSGERHGG